MSQSKAQKDFEQAEIELIEKLAKYMEPEVAHSIGSRYATSCFRAGQDRALEIIDKLQAEKVEA